MLNFFDVFVIHDKKQSNGDRQKLRYRDLSLETNPVQHTRARNLRMHHAVLRILQISSYNFRGKPRSNEKRWHFSDNLA